MYLASMKLKFSKLDQDNLEQKVQEWVKRRPGDKFFFRGYGEKLEKPILAEDRR